MRVQMAFSIWAVFSQPHPFEAIAFFIWLLCSLVVDRYIPVLPVTSSLLSNGVAPKDVQELFAKFQNLSENPHLLKMPRIRRKGADFL